MSGINAARRSAATWRSPNSWKPGESIKALLRAASIQYHCVAVVVCAGFQGAFALDDAYSAGRIVQLVQSERTDAAIATELIALSKIAMNTKFLPPEARSKAPMRSPHSAFA